MRKLTFILVGMMMVGSTIVNADEKLVDLVKKVKPSVVLIETFDKNNKPIGQGSGFFIDNKGRLITNHHVIEGAYSATIKTSSGKKYPVQGIVAKDTEADLVKLVVNLLGADTTFLNLGMSVPSEGEDIFVIGNPLGFESTVSTGIVSAVRDIPAFGKIFQITAPISPGSSGSPVINSKGEVIGIATLVITKGQNLNFAIPSDKIIALKETSKTPIFESLIVPTADGNDAQKLIDKGLKELWQENWSAALTYFQKATEKNPQNAYAWVNIGHCYHDLGRYQEAIDAFKEAIKNKPNCTEVVHHALGIIYYNLGRYQEAAKTFKEATVIKSDYVDAYSWLGIAYWELGRYQEAIESCKQAIRIKPDDYMAHYGLGATYDKLGRYQEAIESCKQAIKINPHLAEAHFRLGRAYHGLGRYQEEIDAFKQAIRIKSDYAEAYACLGITYCMLDRYQEAIGACKQAIRIKSDYANPHKLLGIAYWELGRYQEAIESCKQAIRIKPDDADAHYRLGTAYGSLGRYQEEMDAYKQAIRIKPDDVGTHLLLGIAYLRIGDKGSALDEYKILKTLDTEQANELFNMIYK